jgi:hypothetical protein
MLQVKHRRQKTKKREIIGVVPIEFHELINQTGVLLSLPLTHCTTEGAVVNLRVSRMKVNLMNNVNHILNFDFLVS